MTRNSRQPRNWRLSRTARARIGYFAGVLLVAAGLAYAVAPGWGLVVAGIGLVAHTVLLYDVDEPEPIDDEQGVRLR